MEMTKRAAGNTLLYFIILVSSASLLGGQCLASDSDWRGHRARFNDTMKAGKFSEALPLARSAHSVEVRKAGPGSKTAIEALYDFAVTENTTWSQRSWLSLERAGFCVITMKKPYNTLTKL